MIDSQMNAVRLNALGDPAGVTCEVIPTPQPGRAEVLVRVARRRHQPRRLEWPEDRLPATPSYEFSGVAATTGPAVQRVQEADERCVRRRVRHDVLSGHRPDDRDPRPTDRDATRGLRRW